MVMMFWEERKMRPAQVFSAILGGLLVAHTAFADLWTNLSRNAILVV